jgi:hypothetical protein
MEIAEIRNSTKAMYPHLDFDALLTFYYDETNNIKKLHLKRVILMLTIKQTLCLGAFALVEYDLT